MKKLFMKNHLFLSFVVLIGLSFTVMGYGAAIVSVSPEQIPSPAIGEHIQLNIQITDGKDIAGYNMLIVFAPTALRYMESTNGDCLPTGTFAASVINTADGVSIAATSSTGIATSENGTLEGTFPFPHQRTSQQNELIGLVREAIRLK